MLFTITKEFSFSASHQLLGLPETHQCRRLHGHNYIVKVKLSATGLRPPGFVMDYADLAPFKRLLDTEFDHRHLNEILLAEPTAENLAEWLVRWCLNTHPEWPVKSVGVSETPKTWAWATP